MFDFSKINSVLLCKFDAKKYHPVLDQKNGTLSEYDGSKPPIAIRDQAPPCVQKSTPHVLYLVTIVFAGLAGFFFFQNLQFWRQGSFQTGYKY